jgi:hypothetical protein
MPVGLVPVVTGAGGDRPERDDQVRPSADPGSQPPGAPSSGRPVPPIRVNVNRGPVLAGGS